jgi:cysteine desulfurase family protein (TIGR01976 family)
VNPARDPGAFDLAFARSHFPALREDWALFDNAGGSPPLRGVIDRVGDYMSRWQVQHGASYAVSAHATELFAGAHRAMAELVNAAPDEIVLGASTTANVRLLARALRPRFGPGDEIVVTDLDHEANVGAWRELEADGVRIREWRFDRATCELTLEGLEPLLGPRTRLVCFTHCSNVVGTVHDAAAFVRRIHAAGALACVDGVAFAPHRRVDVKEIGADFYLVSLYKVFGPHLGLLHGRREVLLECRGQNHFFVPEHEVPYKLEPGSVPHELAAALPAIAEYLLALDAHHGGDAGTPDAQRYERAFARIARHEAVLVAPLLAFLEARPGVRVLGVRNADPDRRVPTVAFTVAGRGASEVPLALDTQGIAIRHGHFYAHRAIAALGLLDCGGVVRVSMAHHNTPAEVGRLLGALERIL